MSITIKCLCSALLGYIIARHLIPKKDLIPYIMLKYYNENRNPDKVRLHFKIESSNYLLFNYTIIYYYNNNGTSETSIWTIERIISSLDRKNKQFLNCL